MRNDQTQNKSIRIYPPLRRSFVSTQSGRRLNFGNRDMIWDDRVPLTENHVRRVNREWEQRRRLASPRDIMWNEGMQDNRQLRGVNRPVRSRRRSLNFEDYASEGNRFVNEVARELDLDRNHAARVTRAVLHALRDRIPPDDAIQFAQGLPMALKGVFIDGYDPSDAPVILRKREDFIEYVYYRYGPGAWNDFPDMEMMADAISGVFFVLEQNMDEGQVEQIRNMLNKEIAELIP